MRSRIRPMILFALVFAFAVTGSAAQEEGESNAVQVRTVPDVLDHSTALGSCWELISQGFFCLICDIGNTSDCTGLQKGWYRYEPADQEPPAGEEQEAGSTVNVYVNPVKDTDWWLVFGVTFGIVNAVALVFLFGAVRRMRKTVARHHPGG